jgi:hypothetical protein
MAFSMARWSFVASSPASLVGGAPQRCWCHCLRRNGALWRGLPVRAGLQMELPAWPARVSSLDGGPPSIAFLGSTEFPGQRVQAWRASLQQIPVWVWLPNICSDKGTGSCAMAKAAPVRRTQVRMTCGTYILFFARMKMSI